MATKKKEEELAAPEAQSGYDTSGLENRQQVEEAMAGAGYRPGQSVTNAANALKEWQDKRPEAYQSCYQGRINVTLNPGQFDSPSSLSSFDLDCSRYVYKMTYSEGFKDVYGKVSEYQNRGLMNSRSWAPIMPGSVLDMAGQLVCPAR